MEARCEDGSFFFSATVLRLIEVSRAVILLYIYTKKIFLFPLESLLRLEMTLRELLTRDGWMDEVFFASVTG